tara:strand:- start:156 stop:1949 length:1794 start_codon:yes stop_codon:yes gene_type:complete
MADTTTQTGNIYNLSASTKAAGSLMATANEQLWDEDRVRASDIGSTVTQKVNNIARVKSFRDSINSIEDRDSAFSDEHRKQTRKHLEVQRDALANALMTGVDPIDKSASENAEANLQQTGSDLVAWDALVKEVPKIGGDGDDAIGFSVGTSPEDEWMIREVSNTNAQLNFGEDGTVTYDITMPDGTVKNVSQNQFGDILEKNMVPKEFMKTQGERNIAFVDKGKESNAVEDFDYDTNFADNLSSIDKRNNASAPEITSLMFDKGHIPGSNQPIVEILFSNPKLVSAIKLPISDNTEDLDDNNDGFITIADFKAEDWYKLMDVMLLPENHGSTYDMIAEVMTLKNKQNFEKGFYGKPTNGATTGGSTQTTGGNTQTTGGGTQGGGTQTTGGGTQGGGTQTTGGGTNVIETEPERLAREARENAIKRAGITDPNSLNYNPNFPTEGPDMTTEEMTPGPLPKRRRVSSFFRKVFGLQNAGVAAREKEMEDDRKTTSKKDNLEVKLDERWAKTLEKNGWPEGGASYVSYDLSAADNPKTFMKKGDIYQVGLSGVGGSDSSMLERARKQFTFFSDLKSYKPVKKQEIIDGKKVTIVYFIKIK